MIEVGWDEDEPVDSEPSPPGPGLEVGTPSPSPAPPRVNRSLLEMVEEFDEGLDRDPGPVRASAPASPSTEAIVDPYAEIQARSQWSIAVEAVRDGSAEKFGRSSTLGVAESREDGDDLAVFESEEGSRSKGSPLVRAESGQEFAPYGRLFSQINSANGPD